MDDIGGISVGEFKDWILQFKDAWSVDYRDPLTVSLHIHFYKIPEPYKYTSEIIPQK